MAAPTNSYQRVAVSNDLEDIQDLIYDTSPTECPFVQNSAMTSADNTTIEWVEDLLDEAQLNAHIDGDVFDAEAIQPPKRLTNECQIARKDFRISRRARRINKAGPDDEVARQVTRKGRELKRDMEKVLMGNQGKVVDNGTLAPLTASINAWIADTDTLTAGDLLPRGASGRTDRDATTGADPTGDGTDGATDSSATRALSEGGLLGVVKGIYTDSQEMPDALMLGPTAKQQFSKYMFSANARIATQYQDQGATPRGGVRVVGAVDVWVTDYCVVDVVPDRFMRERDAIFLNFDYTEVAYFDPISTDAMAKDSDTDSRMVLADFGLRARNRYTLGVFADVNENSDMSA